jgi:hypothetical protein
MPIRPFHPSIVVDLSDVPDDAFAIIGRTSLALRSAGVPHDRIAEFKRSALIRKDDPAALVAWISKHMGVTT